MKHTPICARTHTQHGDTLTKGCKSTHTRTHTRFRMEQDEPSSYLLGEKAHGKLCAWLLTLAVMGQAALQR